MSASPRPWRLAPPSPSLSWAIHDANGLCVANCGDHGADARLIVAAVNGLEGGDVRERVAALICDMRSETAIRNSVWRHVAELEPAPFSEQPVQVRDQARADADRILALLRGGWTT